MTGPVTNTLRSAVEMTVGGKARKTKNRFPSLPTALGNRLRDSHIPTAPTAPLLSQNHTRKESLRYRPACLPSGSSFDENMLGAVLSSAARARAAILVCLQGLLNLNRRPCVDHKFAFAIAFEARCLAGGPIEGVAERCPGEFADQRLPV